MKTLLSVFAILFFCIVISACCSQRRIDNVSSTKENPQITEGRIIFKNKCDKCHPGGESGVGWSLNSVNLPGFITRFRVRSRGLLLWTGKMPAFDKHEISKTDMDHLVKYIKHLHHSESEKLLTGK